MKMFSGFLENEINGINLNNTKDIKQNNNNLEFNKKVLFMNLENNNKNENSALINDKLLSNKRNNSSKALLKINRKLIGINNETENNNLISYLQEEIRPIKNNKNKDKISYNNNINYNFDFLNNLKLNITDANINIKPNILMNNNN